MKMIHLTTFEREIRTGSSLPLVAAGDDGATYVVKPFGNGDGIPAAAVEWIAFGLARALGVPVVEPALVVISTDFIERELRDRDPEIRELAERSPGVNFATTFVADAIPLTAENLETVALDVRDEVFLFDVFLLNFDRTPLNSNLIFENGVMRCLDFSSAMALRAAVIGNDACREAAFLRELRRHPFYRPEIEPRGCAERLAAISKEKVAEIVAELPEAWMASLFENSAGREELIERLRALLRDAGTVIERRLGELKTVEVESDAARRARTLANRKAFTEKFGIR